MPRTFTVQGENTISEKMRYDALTTLNKLDDTTLTRLAQLSKSDNAKNWIKNKWIMVKKFLGA